ATADASFSYQVPAAVDPDGDDLTYAALLGPGSNPLPNWLSFAEATRTFSGTPRKAHAGEYEIQVTVSDGKAAAKKAKFTLTVVLPQNRPPETPTLSSQTATEDVAYSYVAPEFDDPDKDTVTYAAALDDGSALPGWLSFNATSRTFSGTPLEADTPATHTVKVTATDDGSPSKSSSATFTLTVAEVNDAPAPVDDSASVAEGGSVDVTATTLLANDTDPEGDTLSITAVGGAVNGSVTLAEDKSKVRYTHDGSETTTGSFTYTVSDGTATGSGTVSVTVTPVNDAPSAVADTLTVAEGGEVEVAATTLLANETDAEGDTLSITAVGGAVNGSVALSEDKSKVTYTHDGSETTSGSFTYTVSDGTDTATGTVSVTVTPVNNAPTGVNDTATVAEGGEVEVAVTTLLANDTDAEGDSLSITAVGGAVNGSVTLAEDKSKVTYTHDGSETTTGSFTYTVSDGIATATGSVAVTVSPANDGPSAGGDTATVAEGGNVEISVESLLSNDSDPEGESLSFTGVGGAVNGSVTVSEDMSEVTYTHDGSETTSGSFTYTVSDGTDMATGTVSVTVTPVNDAPTGVNDTATVAEGGEVEITAATLLANDTDAEGDSLSITAVGGAVNGSVTLAEDKSKVTYTHDGSETTPGSFTYTVSDGTATATATVSVTVTPVNDAPSAVADTLTVSEGGEVEVAVTTLLSNDSDPEGDTLSITAVGGAVNGSVALSEDKSKVTYTHDGSETTSVSFTYTVSDGTATATGSVAVTVSPTNDAPSAVADTLTVAEGGEVEVAVTTLLANDTDAEGDSLSITAAGSAVNGTVALSADKSRVTYTHDGGETTSGSFTYTVSDGTATATGAVSVTVTPVNDPPGELTLTDQTATADASFSYQVPAAVDPDDDDLTYTAFLGAGSNPLPDWLSFDEETRTLSGTPRRAHAGEYEIQVTVSDGTAAAKKAEFTLTVALPPNRPPGAPALTSQTVTEDEAFSYVVPEFEDPDENTVTYTAALDDGGSLPGWLSFNATSRTLSGTPLEADTPASHTIRVTATDDANPPLSSSATFTLTVAEVNDAPSAPVLADQAALVARTFSYTIAAVTDPEGGDITYAATVGESGELPSWLSFDADGRVLSGTAGESDAPAELTIRITATDDGDPTLVSSAEFTLTVSKPNGAPQAVDDTATVAEGHVLTIPSSALLANDSDPDAQTLAITRVGDAVNGTVALSADGTTVTYRHGGTESTSGSFTYAVSDGVDTDTATVALTVTPVNDPPAAPSVAGQTAVEDEPFSYRFAAVTDAEGDGVTYTSALAGGGALPPWLSFNAGTRTFSGTPREADTPSTLAIAVTASDDGEPAESATSTFTLTVVAVNDPPSAPNVVDQVAYVGEPFAYTVPASYDPDSLQLAYAAVQGWGLNPLPRWMRFNEETRTLSGTPLEADVAEHEILLSVSDELHTVWAVFTLSVEIAPNRPPVPPAIPSQEATEDLPFTFVVPPFADPDEDSLEYSAGAASPDGAVADLPGWLEFDTATRVLSGTPREGDTPGVLIIVVTATDDGDPPASTDVRFTLNAPEVNDVPTASAGADQTATAASVVTLDGTGSRDPEGDSLSYAWRQEGEPQVTITGADSAVATFLVPEGITTDVELVFTLVVTDEAGAASEPDAVSVRVVGAERPPVPVVPVITIEAEIASVVEGQVASFRIWAAPSPDRAVAVVMDVSGGDAYGIADGQRDVFILPGDTLAVLVLPTEDDYVDEPPGRIGVVIREQPLYNIGAKSSAFVIVNDNDEASIEPTEEATDDGSSGSPTLAEEAVPTPETGDTLAFGPSSVGGMSFFIGEGVAEFQLPSVTGGYGNLRYELAPELPDGLRFDADALTISGVPAGEFAPTRFTLTVTDERGNRTSLTFMVTVAERPAVPTATPAHTPEPTFLPRTPAPGPTASQPVEDPQPTVSTPLVTAAPTIQPSPAPTPTVEAGEPFATDASAPRRTPEPTPRPALSSPPAPRPTTPQPAEDLPSPASTPPASAAPTAAAPTSPAPTTQLLPAPTPTVEVEEPTATSAAVPVYDEQGVDQMGWIVTTVLAGVTAATGGLVLMREPTQ
ncbi:MAG: Ig-like domain-containing protein, partial [Chloroflexota bacterium]|nr:Ig-like domain-containing protein [Chloroflexota bacterium]